MLPKEFCSEYLYFVKWTSLQTNQNTHERSQKKSFKAFSEQKWNEELAKQDWSQIKQGTNTNLNEMVEIFANNITTTTTTFTVLFRHIYIVGYWG